MSKVEGENFQEWLEVVDAVYSGNGLSSEAIFVHGWPDLIPETMALVARLYLESNHPMVVLNGLSSYGVGAPGISECRNLLQAKGIPSSDIHEILDAEYTLAEAREFLAFAKERSISSATIVTVPQHLLRAFLTDLGAMQATSAHLSLYPRTIPPGEFAWEDTYGFMPLLAPEPERATRLARFAAECARIIDYSERMKAGDSKYTMASIFEAHRYLHRHRKQS